MPSVVYDVELIRQEANPICWIASCAMVKGFQTKTSVGVGAFTGGFDPSNSSIANLATNWQGSINLMTGWGFKVNSVTDIASGGMTAAALLSALQTGGPAVLLHLCAGFPYGSGYDLSKLPAGAKHAVVITSVNTDAGTATFDNPWGDKDRSCDLPTLIKKINSDQTLGKTIGFYPAPADAHGSASPGSSTGAGAPAAAGASAGAAGATGGGSQAGAGAAGAQSTNGSQTDAGTPSDAGAQADAGPQADTGTQTDPGAQGDPTAQADAGPQADSGTQSDAGAEADPGAQSDPAAQSDTGAQTDTGTQPSAGAQTDSGGQTDAGTQTDAPAADAGAPAADGSSNPVDASASA